MLYEDSRIVASFDPHKKEVFHRGIMYRLKKNGTLREIWRVNHERNGHNIHGVAKNKNRH